MSGSAHIIRANSLRIPLANRSAHLAITSPGYFGLRDYRDGGKSVRHQIGAEATPEEHLRALWAVADEVWRTLVDWGSYFVNYGEKYSQSGGHNNSNITDRNLPGQGAGARQRSKYLPTNTTRRNAPDSYIKNPGWARPQSLMGLPWAFALGMINPRLYRDPLDPPKPGTRHPQWILRARTYPDDEPAEHIWHKPNCLPESPTRRVRNDIETILHFSKSEDSYTAIDEIRKPLAPKTLTHRGGGSSWGNDANPDNNWGDGKIRQSDPRGSLPGSVWEIASEPLKLPTWRVVVAGRTTQWFEPRTAPKSKPPSDGGMLAPTGRTTELRNCLGSKIPQPPPRDMAYEDALRYMRAMGTAAGRPSLRPVSPHFACVDEETEILTQHGWIRHDQLEEGELVAGYDLDSGLARWTTCHAVHRYPYDGQLVSVEKRDLSMRLTPNHRAIASRRRKPRRVVFADELTSQHFIPRSAEWEDFGEKSIGEDMAALCGWIAADGWYQSDLVRLSQSLEHNPGHVAAIDTLLERFPYRLTDRGGRSSYQTALGFLERKERKRIYKGQPWTDIVWRLPLWLGHEVQTLLPDKLLGPWTLQLPASERRALLNAFIDGDGHRRPDGRIGIFQKNRQNLDVLQAIAVTLGYKTTLRRGTDKWVLYLTAGYRPITLRGTNGSCKPVPREHYKGLVWCPTTGTGTFVARRNGSVFVTGNSFPTRLPELIIRGWSPPAICTACGQGRRPVVEKTYEHRQNRVGNKFADGLAEDGIHGKARPGSSSAPDVKLEATILGYACACTPYTDHPERRGRDTNSPKRAAAGASGYDWEAWKNRGEKQPTREYHLAGWTPPPSRPSVILDPFVGTGTSCLVAKTLGRIGIGIDLSHSYAKVAEWRCASGQGAKAEQRTWAAAQSSLF